jgi:hypothetical protein
LAGGEPAAGDGWPRAVDAAQAAEAQHEFLVPGFPGASAAPT